MVLAHQVRECRCIVRCVDSPHSYGRGPDPHPPGRARVVGDLHAACGIQVRIAIQRSVYTCGIEVALISACA